MSQLNQFITLSDEVSNAIQFNQPVVALESTVITHGLPRPQNLRLAQDMEKTVRAEGAVPATIAVLDGKIHAGLDVIQLEKLSNADDAIKISLRDFAAAITQKKPGGTTVAGTMHAAQLAGIPVFATGGIGGVHKEAELDISTDLTALASIPMVVVCAGAKSILNLPATLEYLETQGVPVIGYKTARFPEFFSVGKNLPVSLQLDSPGEIVNFARTHWKLGMRSAVLVCQPIPDEFSIDSAEIQPIMEQVSNEVREMQKNHKISGQQVTPYELMRVNELTSGKSLRSNLQLLLNNAALAAKISAVFSEYSKLNKQI